MPGTGKDGKEAERRVSIRADDVQEVRKMETAQGMTWKEIAAELTKDFMAWGCRFDRKHLPEIAMEYECTPLFFWNWMDDPETPRSEKGFLRVLGYAWRKHMQEEADPGHTEGPETKAANTNKGRKIAA